MTTLFIDGAAGTTGLEIRERLAGRSDFTLITLDGARRKDAESRRAALNDADIVILCLPDEAAREAVALIDNARTRVIDASSAHRVADGWVYGFAELEPGQAGRIAAARLVANPGCYPTGFLALVRPLVQAGILPAAWPLSVSAVSGYSGGGRAMIAAYEAGATTAAAQIYATTLGHKHLPEMQRHAGLAHPPLFAPMVANAYRGMIVEVPLPLHALPGRPTLAACVDAWREAYRDTPLVRVADECPATIAIESDAGSDRMTLYGCGDEAAGQARLVATLDNLGKGAAGAAVQNLNIMIGCDPVAGLTV